MNESEFNQLRESSWRRPLTPAEEARVHAYLTTRPEMQQAWETDAALTHFLSELPNVPISSNFTAQVLSALDAKPTPLQAPWWSLERWPALMWPRMSWAAGLLLVGVLSFGGYRYHTRTELARGVDLIAEAMPAEPAILQDFDAIQRWAHGPMLDQELWVALNQPLP